MDIEVRMSAHHLIYGELSEMTASTGCPRQRRRETLTGLLPTTIRAGTRSFVASWSLYLEHPRRFIYTPLMMCKGKKPIAQR